MLRDSNVEIFDKKISLKSLQSIYQAVLDEYFSGARGITELEFSGESVAFKSRYIYELIKVLSRISSFQKDSHIVDFGCERGDMLLVLQRCGFTKLSGINLTPYDLRWLTDKRSIEKIIGDNPNQIKYLVLDMDNRELPYKNDEVSIAILSDVIEHLDNPGWVLHEINRVMIKGGLIVLGTPNIASIKNRLYLLFGSSIHPKLETWLGVKYRMDGRYIGHTREYTLNELKMIMQIYGFKTLSSCFIPTFTIRKDTKVGKMWLPPFLFKLYSLFEKIWPGARHRIIIVAQKVTDNIEPNWVPRPY